MINVKTVLNNEVQYAGFLKEMQIKDCNISQEAYRVMGGCNYKCKSNILDIETFLCSCKELDQGICIVDKDKSVYSEEFLALSEEFNWIVEGSLLTIWDEENSVEVKVSNETKITGDTLNEICIDGKFTLEIL